MFPAPDKTDLSIRDIADYWSRETHATELELRDVIVRAWWGGNLQNPAGTPRLEALKILFEERREDWITFVLDSVDSPPVETERDDGGVEVDLRLRVPLPNNTPEAWTDANCADAFDVLSREWTADMCKDLVVGLLATTVARVDFMDWIERSNFAAPKFWGQKRMHKASSKPLPEKATVKFVEEFLREVKPAATMTETEAAVRDHARAAGKTAHRPWVRKAYHKHQEAVGFEVRRGRRINPPA